MVSVTAVEALTVNNGDHVTSELGVSEDKRPRQNICIHPA